MVNSAMHISEFGNPNTELCQAFSTFVQLRIVL
jgi:hypothetical protein